jgi:hypothetical protein
LAVREESSSFRWIRVCLPRGGLCPCGMPCPLSNPFLQRTNRCATSAKVDYDVYVGGSLAGFHS